MKEGTKKKKYEIVIEIPSDYIQEILNDNISDSEENILQIYLNNHSLEEMLDFLVNTTDYSAHEVVDYCGRYVDLSEYITDSDVEFYLSHNYDILYEIASSQLTSEDVIQIIEEYNINFMNYASDEYVKSNIIPYAVYDYLGDILDNLSATSFEEEVLPYIEDNYADLLDKYANDSDDK